MSIIWYNFCWISIVFVFFYKPNKVRSSLKHGQSQENGWPGTNHEFGINYSRSPFLFTFPYVLVGRLSRGKRYSITRVELNNDGGMGSGKKPCFIRTLKFYLAFFPFTKVKKKREIKNMHVYNDARNLSSPCRNFLRGCTCASVFSRNMVMGKSSLLIHWKSVFFYGRL